MRRRVLWKGEDAEEYVYKEEPAVERRDEAATEDSGFWMLMRRKEPKGKSEGSSGELYSGIDNDNDVQSARPKILERADRKSQLGKDVDGHDFPPEPTQNQ